MRGKYRDVILPMRVLRRFDALLEQTKEEFPATKESLDKAGITEQAGVLRQAAGRRSRHLAVHPARSSKARASRQQLHADFEAYLDGFSPNVQEILENSESAIRSLGSQSLTTSAR